MFFVFFYIHNHQLVVQYIHRGTDSQRLGSRLLTPSFLIILGYPGQDMGSLQPLEASVLT